MSTVTGRQIEFETVDLEALREAFRDHTDEKKAKADRVTDAHDVSVPDADEKPGHSEGSGMSAPDTEENFGLPDDRGMSAPDTEENSGLPDDRGMSVPDAEENSGHSDDVWESPAPTAAEMSGTTDTDFSYDVAETLRDNTVPEAGQDETAPDYLEMVIEQLSKKYEDKHRMSVELSSDVFTAIGKAKALARQEHE